MINGNANNFIDHSTYEEVAVMYNDNKYFFRGLLYDKKTHNHYYAIDLWDEHDHYVETVYRATAESADECMQQFLSAPIIDGKSFWELEKDMEWIEW